jgi:hypothetical protein
VKRKNIYDYILFFEACIYLSFAKLLILFFPFKKIAALIGRSQVESPIEVMGSIIIKDIEISMIRAVKYALFTSKCYDQALATTFMLKRRKISSTIYFGLHKETEQLLAHAWVRCGDKIVSGKLGYERFTPIAWFASHNLA